jgi:hypothetical protein
LRGFGLYDKLQLLPKATAATHIITIQGLP